MNRLIITAILILIAITVYARAPARAAMEEEEIWVRIVTRQKLRCTVKPGLTRCVPIRNIRRTGR
jgi:hypothetical protein